MSSKKPEQSKNIRMLNNTGMSVIGADLIQKQMSRCLLPAVNIEGASDEISNLLRLYMKKLIEDKKMYKRSEVNKMNILDTTGFLLPPDNGYGMPSYKEADEKEREAIDRLGWYSAIPCFEKGAMKLNKFRYVVFEILEIDSKERSIKIALQDYLKPENSIWQLGVSTTVTVKFPSLHGEINEHCFVGLQCENNINFVELYTMYNATDLGWTKIEYDTWLNTVVKNSEYITEQILQKQGTNQCEQLAQSFILLITRCNAMLEMNKPSRPINTKKAINTGQKRSVIYEKDAAPKRKIRQVGALYIQSEKVPRKPCLETVVTYKVAKWTVRGYTRCYKSGKTVYIKPSTRVRKALADTNQVTATTIRFRKSKKSEKD